MVRSTRITNVRGRLALQLVISALAFSMGPGGLLSTSATAQDESIQEMLLMALSERLPWQDAQVELTDIQVQGDLPSGDWWLEMTGSEVPRGRVRARVMSDTTMRRAVWVSADARIAVPAVIAERAIPAGAEVGNFTRVELRDIGQLPRDFATEADIVAGLVTRRALREGHPIRTSQLEAPQLVDRNQVVVLEVRRGAIYITDRGVALEPGRQGETIQVRSLSSDEIVSAMVRDLGRVEIP